MAFTTKEEKDMHLLIEQIKQYRDVQHLYTFFYFGVSIFFTSFEKNWLKLYGVSSSSFILAMILMGTKEPGRVLDVGAILDVIFKSLTYCGFMGSITYFIRYLMTETFMY